MHAEIINHTFIKLLTNLRTALALCVCKGKKKKRKPHWLILGANQMKLHDAKWFNLEIY